jgi:PBSX family phage terminase large subunit
MVLSQKQKEFILKSTAKINIGHGAISSGKSHAANVRWTQVVHKSPDSDLVMCGYSVSSVLHNVVEPFMKYNEGYTNFKIGATTPILTFMDKKIRIVGANDQGAVGKIQGASLSGAYIDEMTLIAPNFLDMLISRLRKPHSICIGTSNPDSPYHPVKKLIDGSDGKNVYALHFEMKDNPVQDPSYLELVNKVYSGLWYRRYVLGQWIMAEGAIYDCFDRKTHVVDRHPNYPDSYIVGIDYGAANPFAAVLISVNRERSPSLVVESELYWDPKEAGRQKTNSEYADMIEEFIHGRGQVSVFLDPSAESFQIELRKRGIPAQAARNDVQNGINTVSNFLSQGDLAIHNSCTHLIQEIEGYCWNPKKLRDGVEEPIKDKDHACDAMRYAIYTNFGRTTRLRSPKVDPWQLEREMRKKMNSQNPFGEGYGWKRY